MIETFEEVNDCEYDIWPRKDSLYFFGPRELVQLPFIEGGLARSPSQNDKFSNIW